MNETVVPEKDKVVEAVAVLIRKTQEGEIVWEAIDASRIPEEGRDYERIESAYKTLFSGRILRLYKRTYRQPPLQVGGALLNFMGTQSPHPKWVNLTILEYLDEGGNILWSFPQVEGLRNLFVAVQYQAGGKDLLNDILAIS